MPHSPLRGNFSAEISFEFDRRRRLRSCGGGTAKERRIVRRLLAIVPSALLLPDALDGRIHIGKFKNQCGGVARNICESLYKIGFPSHFVTVLGKDEAGEKLKSSIPALCRDDLKISSEGRSAQCIVVFDEKKECKFLMGDLDIHSEINAEMRMWIN
ncbi:unnamed protein product [Brassicogethes aeneus]|uniref:Carbohydrate kinase PfkB domain-containing protein n=1 Tax=Brassicogethes aeneus TaxID=1431903 RepID=A0A9P0B7R7_BRAAE|nr:unnamed protein product [Brassicogethes aeneus]